MLEEMPFEAVTIRAIAQQAGVGYATYFRHYADREELLGEIAGELIAELVERIVPFATAGNTAAVAKALTAFVDRRRKLCHALLVGGGDVMRGTITTRAREAARRPAWALPNWLPTDLAITHTVDATLSILRWWLESGSGQSAATMGKIIDRLVFAPTAR